MSKQLTSRRTVAFFAVAVALSQLIPAVLIEVDPTARDPWAKKLEPYRGCAGRTLVVVGTSRAQGGVDPAVLSTADVTAFNLAKAGANQFEQVTLARRIVEVRTPDFVLVEAFPAMMASERLERETVHRPEHLSWGEFRHALPYSSHPAEFTASWASRRAVPLLNSRDTLYGWGMRRGPVSWSPFEGEVTAERRERGYNQAWAEWHRELSGFEVRESWRQAMGELIGTFAGSRVAILLPPESERFRGWYAAGACDGVRAELAGFGVPVWDCWDWMADDDFADGHHLTRDGADRFSRRLRAERVGRP